MTRQRGGRHRRPTQATRFPPEDAPGRESAPSTTTSQVGAAVAVSLLGLVLVCAGYLRGWQAATGALTLFYVGYIVVVLPYASLLTRSTMTRSQYLLGSVALGLVTYLSWLLSSPLLATRFDETLHVATLDGIFRDGLFSKNAMLPVSPYFPGVELAAVGVHWLTGFPQTACQAIVVGLSRTVLVVMLFWIGERLAKTPRAGALVVLLYSTCPQFWFFNAQFSYQTVAIAVAVSVFAVVARGASARRHRDDGGSSRALAAVLLLLAALAVTHHVTSWLTVIALLAWASVELVRGDRGSAHIRMAALVALAVVASWGAVVLPLLESYLGPLLRDMGDQIVGLFTHRQQGRQFFHSGNVVTPAWERTVMLVSVLCWAGLLTLAGWSALRGRSLGRSPARWVLLAVGAAYPVALALLVVPSAASYGQRSWTFVWMSMSLLVAAWAGTPRLSALLSRRAMRLVVPVAVSVLSLGGCILGSGPDWSRQTGPYLAGAEQRSIDARTVATARWIRDYVPPGSRIATSTTLAGFLPDYARVVPVTGVSGSVNVTPVFVRPTVDDYVRWVLETGRVDFIVVDQRLSHNPVLSGTSFFEGSQGFGDTSAISPRKLDKFQGVPGFREVLRGPVRIYDVRALRGEPEWFTHADDSAPLPGPLGPLWQQLCSLAVLLLAAALLLRRTPRHRLMKTALALPVLQLLGLAALIPGVPVVVGTVALVLVVILVLTGAQRGSRRHDAGRAWPWMLGCALLLGVSVAIAVAGDWTYVVGAVPTPPPPGALR